MMMDSKGKGKETFKSTIFSPAFASAVTKNSLLVIEPLYVLTETNAKSCRSDMCIFFRSP